MPHQKISIAGHVGSGKSVTARLVAERTGWELVSTGAMFRAIATRLGMSVLELNRHAETDLAIDDEIDGFLRDLSGTETSVVIDSRMAWHFVPESFKVYLVVDPLVGGQRVLGAGRSDETYETIEEAAAANVARMAAEVERYHDLYGVRRDEWENYDLIVDTTHASAEQVADAIVAATDPDAGRQAPWLISPQRLIFAEGGAEDGPVVVSPVDDLLFVTAGVTAATAALEAGESFVACWPHPGPDAA